MQVDKKIITTSYKQTQKLGEKFAREIFKMPPQKEAVVLGLQGNLGGGKTTFLQGFAKGLGIKENILSPTFVIQKKFQIPNPKSQSNTKYKILNTKYLNFYHIDCYRLKNEKDILALGFKEIIQDSKNIVAIEWSEKIKKILPKNMIMIEFKYIHPERNRRINKNKREIIFKI